MSHAILLEDLRAKGEKKIKAIWQNAREELDKVRAASGEKLAREESSCALKAGRSVDSVRRRLNLAAQRKAAVIATKAEQMLLERCFSGAKELLPELRKDGYDELFHALTNELPAVAWHHIKVHPEDTVMAKNLFPEAEIVQDESICGGLIALNKDRGITVDNTFSKRLERAWPQLASKLLTELTSNE